MTDRCSGDGEPKATAVRRLLGEARRIAIVRLGSIGDVVATLPLACLLRDILPSETRLAWIAHPAPARIARASKAIDEVITLPRTSLVRALGAWKRALEGKEIDAVIDVHGNVKSAIVDRLTGAPVRVGLDGANRREFLNALGTTCTLPRLASGNKTRRALEIARLLGHPDPVPRFDLEFAGAPAERAGQVLAAWGDRGRPVAVLQLGRLEDVRSWPPRRYAELARALDARGANVLFLAGPDEVDAGRVVERLLGASTQRVRFELGTLALEEVGALCSTLAGDRGPGGEGHVFVGSDTGCLHLAHAAGLRTLGLYGPQDPARTGPVGRGFDAIFHPEAAPCIPCGRRECVHVRQRACMASIGAGEVLRHLPHLPRPGGSGRPVSLEAAAAPAPTPAPKLAARHGRWRAALPAAGLLLATAAAVVAAAWIGPSPAAGGPLAAGVLEAVGAVGMTQAAAFLLGSPAAGLLAGAALLAMMGLAAAAARGDPGVLSALLLAAAVAGLAIHQRVGSPWRRAGRPLAVVAAAGLGAWVAAGLRSTAPAWVPADPPGALNAALWGLREALPIAVVFPLVLLAHVRIRRYREDLGFADRRWRLPRAVLALGAVLTLAVPACRAPAVLLAWFPPAAVLTGAWLERVLKRWLPARPLDLDRG